MHLYELSDAYRQFADWYNAQDAPDAESTAALDAIDGEHADKAEGVAMIFREFAARSDALKAEAARLSRAAIVAANKAASLRGYLRDCLASAGVKTVQGKLLRVSLGAGRMSCDVVGAEAVPDEFKRAEIVVDKRAVIAAVTATGEQVPGCVVERGPQIVRVS